MIVAIDANSKVYGFPDNHYRKEGMKVGGQVSFNRPELSLLEEKAKFVSNTILKMTG